MFFFIQNCRVCFLLFMAAILGLNACSPGNHQDSEDTQRQESLSSDVNYKLFVAIDIEDIQQSSEKLKQNPSVTPNEISIDDINERLMGVIEENFFGDDNVFWPAWNTENLQVLVIDFSNDRATILNNQAREAGEIGARIQYNLSDLVEGPYMSRSNRFGRANVNWADTYYIHSGAQEYTISSAEDLYVNRMRLFIHEGSHVIHQDNFEFTGAAQKNELARGERFPIDIASRRFRNEVYHHLKLSILAETKPLKEAHIRHALYFHKQYLAENPVNARSARLDYMEGQATFIEYLFFEILEDDNRSTTELYHAAAVAILNRTLNKEGEQRPVIQESEFYEIGGAAYAAAMTLGLIDIIDSSISPFDFLSETFKPWSIEASPDVSARVNQHYNPVQKAGLKKVADIRHMLEHSDNVFLVVPKIPKAGMSMWSNPIILDIDEKERAFQIRSQSFSIGKGTLSLQQKSVIITADDNPAFNSVQALVGDQGFPAGEMIVPVNATDLKIDKSGLSVNTKRLKVRNMAFKKYGDHYILVDS